MVISLQSAYYEFDMLLHSIKFDFKGITGLYTYNTSSVICKRYTDVSGEYINPYNPGSVTVATRFKKNFTRDPCRKTIRRGGPRWLLKIPYNRSFFLLNFFNKRKNAVIGHSRPANALTVILEIIGIPYFLSNGSSLTR